VSDPAALLRTTGAVRRFTDRSVDDAVVHQVLDDARFAPSGGNRQPWRVAVIRDPALRRELGDMMQHVWNDYVAVGATGRTPFNSVDGEPTDERSPHVDNDLLIHIEAIPVVLAIAADLEDIAMMDLHLHRPTLAGGASIYPFCWNLLLAARMRGLGGVMTTFLSRVEPVAGPVVGLPEHHALAATVFLGYPERQVTKLNRRSVEEFTTVDRFDGPPFTA
jgi:nitroreductase